MNAAIIVSGGSGTRMGYNIPKQYIQIYGKPIIVWTIEKFIEFDDKINLILVLGSKHKDLWQEISVKYFRNRKILITTGGKNRYHSVKNGLKMIEENWIVGIHDAVRPLVSIETISRCYDSAIMHDSGIPVMPVEESYRYVESGQSRILKKDSLLRVQTPQVFNGAKILKAYKHPYKPEFTDDSSVYEAEFKSVMLVKGNPENIKITRKEDLKIASALLGSVNHQ